MTDQNSAGKGPIYRALTVVAVIVVIAFLLFAYFGTSLSVSTDYATTDIPFVGVNYDVTVKNNGMLTQTGIVFCEVRTGEKTYEASREVTLAPGETKGLMIPIVILGLDTGDITYKRCSFSTA